MEDDLETTNPEHYSPKIPKPRPRGAPAPFAGAPARPVGGFPVPPPPVLPPQMVVPKTNQAKSIESGARMDPVERMRVAEKMQTAGPVKSAELVVCDVCRAWYRGELEERWGKGEDPRSLSKLYGIPVNVIRQHMTHLQASVRLEANVQSITDELELLRARTHMMYSTAESMLEVIRNGLVKEIDPEGFVILNPTTIRDIKPTMEMVMKTIDAGRALLEMYAKLHKLYTDNESKGPNVSITFVSLDNTTKPVIMDVKADSEERLEGQAVRYMAGKTIINTSELPSQKDMVELVDAYLKEGTVSGPEYIGSGKTKDLTVPGEVEE